MKRYFSTRESAIKNSPDIAPEGEITILNAPMCNGGFVSQVKPFMSGPLSRRGFVPVTIVGLFALFALFALDGHGLTVYAREMFDSSEARVHLGVAGLEETGERR
ncbi:hypothetical protein DL95DRAFT_408785 [Leptodontidium sp. 2 PMI_412]|nr:hypothetical protein DL95DRAFT_408785 [Leptodontidium sp. 2 PMI_412]